MKRLAITLCILFAGFCFFDSIIGPSRLTLVGDILGFVGGLGAFMALTYLTDEWTIATNPRTIYEKGLLFDKLKSEIEKAISSNKNSVRFTINKVYHPTAGVYYNVHAEG